VLESTSETREEIEYMNANDMFTPMEAYVVNVTQRMTPGAELRLALSMAVKRNTDAKSVQAAAKSAAKETIMLYDDLKRLFFVLSGFIALIGAFRVYRKFNLEEEGLGKTAVIWFTSALTVFILGSIVELFLF
jgi:hypothetical protein